MFDKHKCHYFGHSQLHRINESSENSEKFYLKNSMHFFLELKAGVKNTKSAFVISS